MSLRSHIKLGTAAILIMISNVAHADLDLSLSLEGQEIPSGGAVVGDLVFTNKGQSAISMECPRKVEAGEVKFFIEKPSGETLVCQALGPVDYSVKVTFEIPVDAELRQPFCLVKERNQIVFDEPGHYRVAAEFTCHLVRWRSHPQDVFVTGELDGYDEYCHALPFLSLGDAFSKTAWAMEMIESEQDLGAYTREISKMIVYNYGAKEVVAYVVYGRGEKADIEKIVNEMVEMAKRVGFGVPMWEYLQHVYQSQGRGSASRGDRVSLKWEYSY